MTIEPERHELPLPSEPDRIELKALDQEDLELMADDYVFAYGYIINHIRAMEKEAAIRKMFKLKVVDDEKTNDDKDTPDRAGS